MPEQRGHLEDAAHPDEQADRKPLPRVLIRLACPGEYDAVGELSDTAYSHDYVISDWYRASLHEVAARAAEHEVWVAVDQQTGRLLGTVVAPRPGRTSASSASRANLTSGCWPWLPPPAARASGGFWSSTSSRWTPRAVPPAW